jgi:FkbM family methyltransferase
MIDPLKFVKSSGFIGAIKRFAPRGLQNRLFEYSMARNKNLLKKAVLEYLGGGGGVSRFLETHRIDSPELAGLWLETAPDNSRRINIGGALLPDITGIPAYNDVMPGIITDTFLFHILGLDEYDKRDVDRLEPYMPEGPYGYRDGPFDVTVKSGDIVIDAGAWIGDFAALASCYGAETYAFEPVESSFKDLEETSRLNNGAIHAVRLGLGSRECEMTIFLGGRSGSESAVNSAGGRSETITITTLDKFVNDKNIKKIDFIKADIEGAERDMLSGARNVLKEFAPKLAICTYHLPDDPRVLKDIILGANPKYKIVMRKCKLYAST